MGGKAAQDATMSDGKLLADHCWAARFIRRSFLTQVSRSARFNIGGT